MILKFFNKEEQSNKDGDLINVACLMIHAAKIDENYTDKEKKIIKNTLIKLDNNNEDIDKVILEAEKKESDSFVSASEINLSKSSLLLSLVKVSFIIFFSLSV